MNMLAWKWVLFALLVIACQPAMSAAQADQPMHFRHLSLQDGLSQSTVMSVLQDSQGLIWLATENGLNRYDGYSINRYHRSPNDPGGLSNDYIWDIAEDANHDLWLATDGGGVARWNRQTDTFDVFRNDPHDPESLASDSVRTLVVGTDGLIWIGLAESGLDLLDPNTGKVKHFRHVAVNPKSLSSDKIFALHLDRAGHLWVGTDEGLNRYNPTKNTFVRYKTAEDGRHSVHSDRVRALIEDHHGSIWVGTFGGGLIRFDPSSRHFTHFRNDPQAPGSLSNDHVRAIFEDDENRLWVGTASGLNLLNRSSMTFSTFRHNNSPESLSDSYVMSISQDRGGMLWVGTRAGGANAWNPRSWSLGHYRADWLEDTNVTAFASDEDALWVATFDKGLTYLQNGIPTKTYQEPDISDNHVMSLLLDRRGRLWIGTMQGGLNRLDPATGTIVTYRHDPTDPDSLSADGVMSLHEDREGNLWVGTFGGGLDKYNRQTDSFDHYVHDPDDSGSLTGPRITAIIDDLDGFVWVATLHGLNRLDPVSGAIVRILHDSNNPMSLRSDTVYGLHVDQAGTLWVATAGGGLHELVDTGVPTAMTFKNYSQPDGLPSNVIYGVYSDAKGLIWLPTNNGVARLNPATGRIKIFRKAHGLQGEEFHFGAHHRNAVGVMFFGGSNGFNAISPDELQENSSQPQVVLTKVETLNQPVATKVPYSLLRELDFDHEDRMVAFEFAALDFTSPEQNQYQYFLEGFDSEWIESGPLRRATYTNLDAGKYTFRVKAANSDGVWNENGIAVTVRVAPAPWLTWWAYSIYIFVGLIIVILLVHTQIKKRQKEEENRRQLHNLAYFDTLTGIPNRHLFMKELQDAISDDKSEQTRIALLFIDLDQFKRINDTLGHRAGDAILKMVTERLQSVVDQLPLADSSITLNLARLGGDEFVVTVSGFKTESTILDHLAKRILDALAIPFDYKRHKLVVTPSIGVSIYPQDAKDVSALLKNADIAMYEAKDAGRNDYKLYSPTMNAKTLDNLALEEDLRRALEQDHLYVVYQPKVDLRSGKVVGAEALLRWTHATRGDVSPANFIPVAEQTGLILDIDRWVINRVCQQIADWQQSCVSIVPIAINLSGREFGGGELVTTLEHAVKHAGIEERHLEVEITEGVLMNDVAAARAQLARLKKIGFHVSIDDFGTGYSSLSYLKGFSLSTLKIDRSFVMDVENSSEDRAICSAIIEMAHGLGLKVVAEGVETEAQLNFLRGKGCDQVQGFLLGRPSSVEDFTAIINNRLDDNLLESSTPIDSTQGTVHKIPAGT